MMSIELFFGAVNLLIYILSIYFTYRIVQNLSENADVASAMFFLKEDARRIFRLTAIMVAFVLAGEILIYASHFYSYIYRAAGYSIVTVASLSVLHWVKILAEVTSNPSESEE